MENSRVKKGYLQYQISKHNWMSSFNENVYKTDKLSYAPRVAYNKPTCRISEWFVIDPENVDKNEQQFL